MLTLVNKQNTLKKHPENWIEDCLKYSGRVLAGIYGHYCSDWDSLPIDETVVEYQFCYCDKSSIFKSNMKYEKEHS